MLRKMPTVFIAVFLVLFPSLPIGSWNAQASGTVPFAAGVAGLSAHVVIRASSSGGSDTVQITFQLEFSSGALTYLKNHKDWYFGVIYLHPPTSGNSGAYEDLPLCNSSNSPKCSAITPYPKPRSAPPDSTIKYVFYAHKGASSSSFSSCLREMHVSKNSITISQMVDTVGVHHTLASACGIRPMAGAGLIFD